MATAATPLALLFGLFAGGSSMEENVLRPAPDLATSTATNSDTVRVAAPAGDSATDRRAVQAAFDAVQPGGTVRFAPGTYYLGAGAKLTIPDVTVLGDPNGTVLRGCDPEAFAPGATETVQIVYGCAGLYVQAERQTIRGIIFEHVWEAIVVGPFPTTVEERAAAGERMELLSLYPAGGQRIEGNTFRATVNGVRALGIGNELSVVRDNDFIDVFHAVGIYGAPLHFLDNRVTVVDPERVPFSGHPGAAVIVSPGHTDCAGHVVAGNRIEGYPDPLYVLVGHGETCRDVEIRDNTIRAARVKVPETGGFYRPTETDSTMVGAPITLMNRTEPMPGMPEADMEGVLDDIVVEGNHIVGAAGLGIVVQGVSRSRIAGNTLSGIQRRTPFPGLTWDGFEQRWENANGSGIWISEGSDENEVVGNTFRDIAASAVVIEGNRNTVELANPADSVRDLGTGNRVMGAAGVPGETSAAAQEWTDPSPHEIRFVGVAPGVQLEVLDWGGEGTPLVFLAGLQMNAHAFDDFAPRFTDTHRVVGITRRGHGASSWPDDGYSLERRVEDIRIVLDSLDMERVIVAGHSLAGMEMTHFASEYSERVAGLVYIDAAHNPPLLMSLRVMEVCPAGPEILEAIERRFENPEAYRRTQQQEAPDGTLRPFMSDGAFAQLVAGMSRAHDYSGARAPALAVYHTPGWVEDGFGRAASLSTACVSAFQRYIYEGIAGFAAGMESGRVVALDDTQHNIHLVSPDALEAVMRRWLAELPEER